jgi:hypothetical protein
LGRDVGLLERGRVDDRLHAFEAPAHKVAVKERPDSVLERRGDEVEPEGFVPLRPQLPDGASPRCPALQ